MGSIGAGWIDTFVSTQASAWYGALIAHPPNQAVLGGNPKPESDRSGNRIADDATIERLIQNQTPEAELKQLIQAGFAILRQQKHRQGAQISGH